MVMMLIKTMGEEKEEEEEKENGGRERGSGGEEKEKEHGGRREGREREGYHRASKMGRRCQVRPGLRLVDFTDFGDRVACLWPIGSYMMTTKESSLKEHSHSSLLGEDCAPLYCGHIGRVSAPGPLHWPVPPL